MLVPPHPDSLLGLKEEWHFSLTQMEGVKMNRSTERKGGISFLFDCCWQNWLILWQVSKKIMRNSMRNEFAAEKAHDGEISYS